MIQHHIFFWHKIHAHWTLWHTRIAHSKPGFQHPVDGTIPSTPNINGLVTPRRQDAYPFLEHPEAPRPCVCRLRSCRQAPQVPRWSRYGRWSTPPPYQHRQVPPRLLR
ncbi:hypothetical protein ACN42_g3173 [Penicillium freii]|uniref:Uncharacterized protein n=1 Tax=Penicillium freii TaxID=48697 RepID=A0A101MNN4_PENFR|nr:hypothetical protein ACN42_g3173 [Penicillium freii]